MRKALVLLLLFVTLPVRAGEESVTSAVREAFETLGVAPEEVRVRDVDFWAHYAPRLREGGRLLETVRLPTEEDGLRPRLVDRALRSPLEAVGLALVFSRPLVSASSRVPAPTRGLVDPTRGEDPPLGEDPIPEDVEAHANVRWLARRLVALEDAVSAALPDGEPDPRMLGWMVEGFGPDEVEDARRAFDRFAAADLEPVHHLAESFLGELSARLARRGGFEVGASLRVETPRGLVIVGSREADVHADDAWLLVDPGGDDVYRNNAGGTGTTRRSGLCLDLGGDDRYESERPFTQGAAYEGLALLVDAEGSDTYRGGAFCQGAAVGGVAVLHDRGGNNAFEATEFAQGAAALGRGILRCGTGADRYTLDRLGQGLGRTGGVGLLHDLGGDDRYVARPTHESLYSQWTNGRTIHWSFAQGCGFGFYARYEETLPDGTTGLVIRDLIPGGVGMLKDAGGDDEYRGSMYAQGTGYFYGLGICADDEGDDVYTATWYGQGAAPHFAVGILVDGAGNDRYTGMHQVQGNGRDFSTGVFLDLAGDDVYVGEDRVQGCGDRRDGYGVFVDASGDDRYEAARRAARGWATLVKPDEQPTEDKPYADYGIFLDLGGEDVYTGKAAGADGSTWTQEATGRGLGIDR